MAMNKIDILNEIEDLRGRIDMVQGKLLNNPFDDDANRELAILTTKMDIATTKWGWC